MKGTWVNCLQIIGFSYGGDFVLLSAFFIYLCNLTYSCECDNGIAATDKFKYIEACFDMLKFLDF